MEVFIDRRPAWSNIVTGLEFDRRTRWGELYKAGTSEVRSVAKHDWLRTPYTFAHAVEKGDEPSIGQAVEYAALDRGEQIYIVTFFGTPAQIESAVETAQQLRLPLFAIGGITPANLRPLQKLGVDRIAVCSCILQSDTPREVAAALRGGL